MLFGIRMIPLTCATFHKKVVVPEIGHGMGLRERQQAVGGNSVMNDIAVRMIAEGCGTSVQSCDNLSINATPYYPPGLCQCTNALNGCEESTTGFTRDSKLRWSMLRCGRCAKSFGWYWNFTNKHVRRLRRLAVVPETARSKCSADRDKAVILHRPRDIAQYPTGCPEGYGTTAAVAAARFIVANCIDTSGDGFDLTGAAGGVNLISTAMASPNALGWSRGNPTTHGWPGSKWKRNDRNGRSCWQLHRHSPLRQRE